MQKIFSQFAFGRRHSQSFDGTPESGTAVAVIGDVHGYLNQFRDMVGQIEAVFDRMKPYRRVIVQVGDLIDRGPDSGGCMDLALQLLKRTDLEFVPLLGNHELMLKYCLRSDEDCAENAPNWMLFGGRDTYNSLSGQDDCPPLPSIIAQPGGFRTRLIEMLGPDRRELVEAMRPAYLNGTLLAVHAGISEDQDAAEAISRPWDTYSADHWAWNRGPSDKALLFGDKQICQIHGHSIHKKAGPIGKRFAIDTGVYRSGILSCAIFAEGEYEILSARGEVY
ncbi:metallophosphoesterase [Aestuariispira insulae]|uniref:metallophosphoesterase n=1 Tax=Aestuariispira insulae TaxID=1461337 RepID=UPI0015F27C90|nr:metallophosphoesterase [Aestuariispira insulae]